jgi:3-O-alpha-D-mannopyranosyl-alpha-D-mannopyranose xylosylphosphotransferase
MDEQESRTYTEIDQIDIVYLWVNSTDPSFPEAFAYRMEEEGLPVDRGQARRWRDNGELRGSVRSSVQSLGDNLRKIHIVSGDYPLEVFQDEQGSNSGQDEEKNLDRRKLTSEDDDTEMTEGWTVGQIPEWLDWAGDDETVTWHFHSDIYRLPRDPNGELLVGREVMGGMVLLGDDGEFVHGTNGSLEQEWRELALPTFNSFAIESRVGWVTGLSEKL